MVLARAYVGTNAIGASALTVVSTKMYVKQVSLADGDLLASVDVYVNTTNGNLFNIRPVLYDDNGGAPGKLISYQDAEVNAVEFNGTDRWVTLPLAYYATSTQDVWIGFHSSDPEFTVAYETTGGNDQQINSGSTWTIDPGATGGSITDPGDHLYSIRASVITGLTDSRVGRTDVGGSWLTMSNGPIYLRSVTVPANSCLAAVVGHLRHAVANVPSLAAYVWEDSGGAPGLVRFAAPISATTSILVSTTGRWLHAPVGLWVDAETDFWIGFQMVGNTSFDIAYDTSGADGGSLASASDSATWTSGDDDYSFHALVLT